MKVRIKKTGQVVEVYKHRYRSSYINADDCTTEYKSEDVELIK